MNAVVVSAIFINAVIMNAVVILQDAQCRTFEIVELAAVHRLEEHPQGHKDHGNRQGDEQIKGFHNEGRSIQWRVTRCRRSAFNTTSAELADMPTPAIHGVSTPKAAAGIATRL